MEKVRPTRLSASDAKSSRRQAFVISLLSLSAALLLIAGAYVVGVWSGLIPGNFRLTIHIASASALVIALLVTCVALIVAGAMYRNIREHEELDKTIYLRLNEYAETVRAGTKKLQEIEVRLSKYYYTVPTDIGESIDYARRLVDSLNSRINTLMRKLPIHTVTEKDLRLTRIALDENLVFENNCFNALLDQRSPEPVKPADVNQKLTDLWHPIDAFLEDIEHKREIAVGS